jgi:NAD(P)-dependent dehydrogenase (short-subunit alcohol dehydrogenase family)
MKLKPIDQQVVVVVGANSGIGRAAALLFARRGAQVVVSARDQLSLESLVEEMENLGGQAAAITADVADFTQVEELARQAVEKYGRIDTWVHSAAVMMYASFEDTRTEEFERMIQVNLLGQIYGAKSALPYLKQNGRGALIHISSVEANVALPLQSAYAATKHGMVGFLDSLRMELQAEGIPISVTNIKPSGINTPLYDKALTRLGVKPRPVPPIYEPETVAEAIVYAAENPVRDMIIGGAGKSLALVKRFSPPMADRILRRIAFEGQRTEKPKQDIAPDNLFHHIEGYNQVRGDFSGEARSTSLYTWYRRNPTLRLGLAAGLLGLATVVWVNSSRARKVPT